MIKTSLFSPQPLQSILTYIVEKAKANKSQSPGNYLS